MLPAPKSLKQKAAVFRPHKDMGGLDVELLFATAENDEPVMLAKMLDEYPDALNVQNEQGQSLLHMAVSWAKTEMADMLLARGIDTTLCDKQGQSASDLAGRLGFETIAQMITSENGQRAEDALQQKLQQECLICTQGLPSAINARPSPVRFKYS